MIKIRKLGLLGLLTMLGEKVLWPRILLYSLCTDPAPEESASVETGRDPKDFKGGCCEGDGFSYPFQSKPKGDLRLVVLPSRTVNDYVV